MRIIFWILIGLVGMVLVIWGIRIKNKLKSGEAQGGNAFSKFYDACCQASKF